MGHWVRADNRTVYIESDEERTNRIRKVAAEWGNEAKRHIRLGNAYSAGYKAIEAAHAARQLIEC